MRTKIKVKKSKIKLKQKQRQRQRQTTNVQVNIDQSRRTQPRKPRDSPPPRPPPSNVITDRGNDSLQTMLLTNLLNNRSTAVTPTSSIAQSSNPQQTYNINQPTQPQTTQTQATQTVPTTTTSSQPPRTVTVTRIPRIRNTEPINPLTPPRTPNTPTAQTPVSEVNSPITGFPSPPVSPPRSAISSQQNSLTSTPIRSPLQTPISEVNSPITLFPSPPASPPSGTVTPVNNLTPPARRTSPQPQTPIAPPNTPTDEEEETFYDVVNSINDLETNLQNDYQDNLDFIRNVLGSGSLSPERPTTSPLRIVPIDDDVESPYGELTREMFRLSPEPRRGQPTLSNASTPRTVSPRVPTPQTPLIDRQNEILDRANRSLANRFDYTQFNREATDLNQRINRTLTRARNRDYPFVSSLPLSPSHTPDEALVVTIPPSGLTPPPTPIRRTLERFTLEDLSRLNAQEIRSIATNNGINIRTANGKYKSKSDLIQMIIGTNRSPRRSGRNTQAPDRLTYDRLGSPTSRR